MCGISGHLNFSGAPDTDLVTRMTACLAHRGPDGTGVRTVGSVALGHRRLAIIDLSAAAGQPMCDSSGSHWIVFNGEIYNFRELRGELVKLGSRFTTESDTEVILEGYKQWGLESLSKLNGMFAFALWDDHQRRLLLARDRLGKKPLYYHRRRDGSVFEVSVAVSPLRRLDGTVAGLVELSTDVSAQRAVARRFERSQRLEAASRMAGGVARDLERLLGALDSGVRALQGADPKAAEAGLRELRAELESARALTVQLRELGAAPQRGSLESLVDDVLGQLVAAARLAGMNEAARATTNRTAVMPAKVSGSSGSVS